MNTSLAAGARLGPYEIVAALGAGGMGEVLRARDTKLGREVAIKVLPAAFAQDAERVARFRREAQILAALNHPNIAGIHGLEESASDGQLALVMELVDGEDLAARLKRGAIPVDEALAIVRQIADALEEAHEKGIVHRDLKPANVKVTAEGKVKVLDFGLAKAFAADATSTSGGHDLSQSPTLAGAGTVAGVILGTAAYMSPEQARGKAVDRRADIWAFGVVLFEVLTGKRLFGGETVSDTLAAVLREEIPWAALPADTPPHVAPLLRRCLTRDPRQRLRDIGDARLALEDAGGVTVPASAPATRIPARSPRRLALSALALAAAFATGYGVGSRLGRGAAPADNAPLTITPVTSSGNVIAAAISSDGRYVGYVESEQGLQSLWLKQRAGGQTLRLIADQPVAYWGLTFAPDGDNIVFGQKSDADPEGALFAISTLGGAPRRLVGGMDSHPSYSPDGRRFTYTRLRHPSADETSLMVANANGSAATVLATFKLPEYVAGIFYGGPAWSPDGRTIVTAVGRQGSPGAESQARLVSVAVEGGAVTTLADPGWVQAAQAGWLPDGRSLLVIARAPDQTTAQIWSVAHPSGEARRVTADLDDDRRIISLAKDGRSLVSVSGKISATVWTQPLRGGGRPMRISRANLDGLEGVAFGPDGRIVYASWDGTTWSLWRADPRSGERSPLVRGADREGLALPALAGDGSVYFVARARTGAEIRVVAPDGSAPRVVARNVTGGPIDVDLEGRTLVHSALVAGLPRVFRVPGAGGEREPVSQRDAFSPAIDPAGRRVAFYQIEAEKRLRQGVSALDGGALLADLPAEAPTSNSRLRLTDDGLYVNTMPGDRANVWLLPLDGGAPRKVTDFVDRQLFDFAISRDGATLAYSRGARVRDAQFITGFDGGGVR